MTKAIIDSGPLVAFFDRDERHHRWVVDQVATLTAPLLVCEPVLTETLFRLGRVPAARNALFSLLDNGALKIGFALAENTREICALLKKYEDRTMSLADACVLRMSELNAKHAVFTLDSDFHVYRKHGKERLSLIAPARQ